MLIQLHPHLPLAGGNAQLVIPQPAHQIERLLHRLLLRQKQGVLLHRPLHRLPHLRVETKKPVGRDHSLQRLVRPLEVVAVEVEQEPPSQVLETAEDRPGQKLLPQSLPEALDLPQGLRMLRPGLEVLDPLPAQRGLKLRLSPPHCVLPPVVGEDLLRRSVAGDGPLQGLHHQGALLVPLQRPAGDEARAVVEKGAEVDPLVPAQEKGEDVRLPELVRLRPLEAPLRLLPRRRYRARLQELRLVQHAPHLALADPYRFKTPQDVANPPRPVLRIGLLQRHYRLPARVVCCFRLRRLPRLVREERLVAALRVGLPPERHRGVCQAEGPADVADSRPSLELLQDLQLHFQRMCPPLPALLSSLPCPSLPCHRLLLQRSLSAGSEKRVLSDFPSGQASIKWRAQQASSCIREVDRLAASPQISRIQTRCGSTSG